MFSAYKRQWTIVQILAGFISLVSGALVISGLGTVREMFASANSYLAGQKDYPDNEIIQGVLPHIEERDEAMANAKSLREQAIARLKEKGIDSPEKIRALLLEDSRQIASLLAQKASAEEAAEYKAWAMSVKKGAAYIFRKAMIIDVSGAFYRTRGIAISFLLIVTTLVVVIII